jgi:hypothetical protein
MELSCNGYKFTLYKRGKWACIYAQHVAPDIRYWKVFVPKIRPAEEIFGKVYPEREVFPGNEDIGLTAYTFGKLENVLWVFDKLENDIINQNGQNHEDETDTYIDKQREMNTGLIQEISATILTFFTYRN